VMTLPYSSSSAGCRGASATTTRPSP
jgi:hypothetical protein